MLSIKDFPSNKDLFIKLINFCKEILLVCKEQGVEPVVYGSLAVFVYTKNLKMKVNDIDMLVKEEDFSKIIGALKENGIKFKYDKKWHVLQVLSDNLKIEFDSVDFWQKDLPRDFKELDFYGLTVKILGLDVLKEVYKKASEVSQDKALENKRKFEELNKLSSF